MIFNGHGWLLEETASQQKSREYRKESQQSKFLHHHHHLGWDQQDDQSVMEHWFSAPVFSVLLPCTPGVLDRGCLRLSSVVTHSCKMYIFLLQGPV